MFKRVTFVCLFLAVFAVPLALGQDATGEEAKSFDWNNLWQMALMGAFGCTFLGKLKKGDFNFKDLDWKRVAQKGIIGVAVGVVASLKGISLIDAEVALSTGDGLAFGTLIIFGIDYGLKAIFKTSAITIRKALGEKKEGGKTENPTPTEPPKEPETPKTTDSPSEGSGD